MPSNILTTDTSFPRLTKQQSTDEKFSVVTNYEQYKQVTKALEAGQKYMQSSQTELDALRSAYDADPTQANAEAYNRCLERFERDLETYNDLVEQYNYFNSAEGPGGAVQLLQQRRGHQSPGR